MNNCVSELRDTLPDFVHKHLDPARMAEVRAHVAACGECSAELEVLNAVVDSSAPVPAIDVARIASALPLPTKHGFLLHRGGGVSTPVAQATAPISARRKSVWVSPYVKVAAVAAIVTAGGLSLLVGRDVLRPEVQVGQTVPVAPAPVAVAAIPPAPPVVETPAATKTTTAAPKVAAATSSGLSLGGDLQDLSEDHLAMLLEDIDKMDALPAAEPESMEPSVGSQGSGIDQ